MASLFTWSFINQSNLVIWCFRKLFYLSCQSIEVRFSLCDDKLHSQEFLLHSRWLSSPYSLYPRIIYISFTVLSPNTWLTEINMTVYLCIIWWPLTYSIFPHRFPFQYYLCINFRQKTNFYITLDIWSIASPAPAMMEIR